MIKQNLKFSQNWLIFREEKTHLIKRNVEEHAYITQCMNKDNFFKSY